MIFYDKSNTPEKVVNVLNVCVEVGTQNNDRYSKANSQAQNTKSLPYRLISFESAFSAKKRRSTSCNRHELWCIYNFFYRTLLSSFLMRDYESIRKCQLIRTSCRKLMKIIKSICLLRRNSRFARFVVDRSWYTNLDTHSRRLSVSLFYHCSLASVSNSIALPRSCIEVKTILFDETLLTFRLT